MPHRPDDAPLTLQDWLTADHARLGALLDAADADPSRFDVDAFERFRAGLARHIAIEEKVLLVEARRRRGGAPIERAGQLRLEHAALGSLLVPTPDAALVREIRGLLELHDAREEGPGGVYEECLALLGADEAAIAERARAYPEVPMTKHFDGHGTHRTAASALAAAAAVRARRATAGRADDDP